MEQAIQLIDLVVHVAGETKYLGSPFSLGPLSFIVRELDLQLLELALHCFAEVSQIFWHFDWEYVLEESLDSGLSSFELFLIPQGRQSELAFLLLLAFYGLV